MDLLPATDVINANAWCRQQDVENKTYADSILPANWNLKVLIAGLALAATFGRLQHAPVADFGVCRIVLPTDEAAARNDVLQIDRIARRRFVLQILVWVSLYCIATAPELFLCGWNAHVAVRATTNR